MQCLSYSWSYGNFIKSAGKYVCRKALQTVTNFTGLRLWRWLKRPTLGHQRRNLNRYKSSTEKTFMDTTLKKLIVFLLGITGLMTAHARQGWSQDEGAYRQNDVARQFFVGERQQRPEPQDQNARRRPNGGRDDGQYNPALNAPPQQKNSKLTPEERRALRRQINEAGQDIYYNGRRGGN
jgi:hypothetical protein